MTIPSFLTGYILGIATLWAFPEVISFAAVRRSRIPPAREADYWSLVEADGVSYRFLGVTGEER